MSDVVGISVSDEPFSVLETSKVPINAQEKEVNDLWELLKFEYNKYVQYKIIYDALEECASEKSDINRTLQTKLRDMLLSSSVQQTLTLGECSSSESSSSTSSLFGLCDINKQELNYIERNQLEEVLKSTLDHKYENICDEFHKLTNKDVNKILEIDETSKPTHMAPEDKVLIEFKSKLIFEQELYIKNLLNLSELLNEITHLRLKKLPQVTQQKIKECQMEERMNHLKSLLMQEKLRIDVFTETSSSLKAYKEFIKDIKEEQKNCEKEIQELKALKEKYNQVSCKQYDDILKSYLQYKSTIEKKKLLYDCLKC